jgi:hypothetical protein
MLSLKGYDIPLGRTVYEKSIRRQVWDIIAPYFLSAEDMKTVAEAHPEEMSLFLESFTATQKGLLYTTLSIAAKEYCIKTYYPARGSIPTPEHAAELGLPAGKSILSR